jgi:hypothetical protein
MEITLMFANPPLTEAQWLSHDDAGDLLLDVVMYHPAERKSRLYVCACARLLWSFMNDEHSRKAVEIAEMHIEGQVTLQEIQTAIAGAEQAYEAERDRNRGNWFQRAFRRGDSGPWKKLTVNYPSGRTRELLSRAEWSETPQLVAALAAAMAVADPSLNVDGFGPASRFNDWKVPHNLIKHSECHKELGNAVALVHCVFGNPFRPIAIDPDWLAWHDGTVPKLAQSIYDDRRFDLLPILADALQEAGCTNNEILQHCHSPGPHVRGCWVVDLLLGKA